MCVFGEYCENKKIKEQEVHWQRQQSKYAKRDVMWVREREQMDDTITLSTITNRTHAKYNIMEVLLM